MHKKTQKKTIKGYYNVPMVRKIKCRTLENNDKRRQTKSRFGNLKIRRNFIFEAFALPRKKNEQLYSLRFPWE